MRTSIVSAVASALLFSGVLVHAQQAPDPATPEESADAVTGTEADGSAISLKYEMPDKGGIGKILAGGPYDAVSGTRIDDNTREVSYVKGGKEMLHVRTVVSKDGKTLTITGKGTDPQGKPVSGVSVWENNSVFLYQQRTLDGVVSRSREEYDAAS